MLLATTAKAMLAVCVVDFPALLALVNPRPPGAFGVTSGARALRFLELTHLLF